MKVAVAASARALCRFLSAALIGTLLVASVSAQTGQPSPQDVLYGYDALGRLETVTYQGFAGDGGDIVYTYTYDQAGNRTVLKVEGNAFATISLLDVYAVEGDVLQIPVISSSPLRGDVGFNWQVTAGAGQVQVASGVFALTAAQSVGLVGQIGTIDIPTVDDAIKESHAEITIQISAPDNVVIDPLNDTATVYLQDNDVTYFTFTDQAVIEGNMFAFTVNKISPPAAPVEDITVTFSTEDVQALLGTDYQQVTPISLLFTGADTALGVTVDALTDLEDEADESFVLKASWTSESQYTGLYGAYGTIENGPPPGPSIFAVSNGQGDAGGQGTLMVSRTGGLDRAYDVSFSVAGGTATAGDYTITTPSPLSFATGVQSLPVNMTLNSGSEGKTVTLQVSWSDVENGAQTAQGILTVNGGGGGQTPGNNPPVAVRDEEPYQIPFDAYIDPSSGGTFEAGIEPAPPGATPIYYGVAGFNVVANDTDADGDLLKVQSVSMASDYAPLDGPTITANGTSITATYDRCGTYVYNYTVADPSGATSSSTLAVTTTPEGGGGQCLPPSAPRDPSDPTPDPNDRPTVTIDDPAPGVNEGLVLPFIVRKSNSYRYWTYVDWSISGTAIGGRVDYDSPLTGTISLAPGVLEKEIKIQTVDDRDIVDPDKTLTITISNVRNGILGAATTSTGMVLNNDSTGNKSPFALPDDFDVVMEVNPVNDSFIGQGTFDVLANDSDPDSDPLTLQNNFRLVQFYGNRQLADMLSVADSLTVVNNQISAAFSHCGYYRFEYDVADDKNATATSFFDVDARLGAGASELELQGCPDPALPNDPVVPTVNIAAATSVEEGQTLLFPVTISEAYPDPVAIGWEVTNNAGDATITSGVISYNTGDPLTQNIELPTTDDTEAEGDETVTVTLTTLVNADPGTITATATVTDNDEPAPVEPVIGEAVFTSPGTTAWIAPEGVTSVNVVVVGAGGGPNASDNRDAGGGGALAWKNNIVVVPGGSYSVIVGEGGRRGQDGDASSFEGVVAQGGSEGVRTGGANALNAPGGTFSGADGGGNGGWGRRHNTTRQGGGGGAGGYSGSGGDGSSRTTISGSGSGGGGAGGSGGGGGGVGLYGIGASGAGGSSSGGGQGGSGGSNGVYDDRDSHGGSYGGGAGGYGNTSDNRAVGGGGAVRIVWGPGLSFPGTANLSDADTTPGPAPSFSIADAAAVTEGGTLSFTVTKTGTTSEEFTVSYTASFGTASASDVTGATSGTLVFGAGDITLPITISTVDDPDDEPDAETLTVVLTSAGGADLGDATAVGTILDNDAGPLDGTNPGDPPAPDPTLPVISMSGTPTGATEGGVLLFPVSISEAPSGTATASWAVTSGIGKVAVSSGIVSFSGSGSQTIALLTLQDPDQNDETVTVSLNAVSANAILDGTLSASATITDDDVPVPNRAPVAAADPGETLVLTPTEFGNGVEGVGFFDVLANDSDPDGDTLTLLDTLRLSEGFKGLGTAGSMSVTGNGQIRLELYRCGTRKIFYDIEDPDGLSATSYLQVSVTSSGSSACPEAPDYVPAPPAPVISIGNAANVTEGGSLSFPVSISAAPSATVTATWTVTTGAGEVSNTTGTVSFPAGSAASRTISVPTIDDNDWSQVKPVTVTLSNVSSNGTIGTASADGGIENDDGEPIINIFSKSIFEGDIDKTVTVTVFLQGGTTQPVTVNYRTTSGSATAGSDYVEVSSGSMTIQPGDFDGTFDVTIKGDTNAEGDEYFNTEVVSAVNARTVTSGITPADPTKGSNGIVTIKNDDYSYSWNTGTWSACSGGQKTRTVTCRRDQDGAAVSDSLCPGSKPATTSTSGCQVTYTYRWDVGSWGSWSSCSGGQKTRTRSVTCKRDPGNSTVGDSLCTSNVGSKPSTTGTSSTGCESYTYNWEYGSFAGWPACTGQTTRTNVRPATCKRSDGVTVSNSNCPGSPDTTRTDTCTYAWNTSSWSSWSCVGVGSAEERTRAVTCRSESGNTVSDGICSGTKPDNVEVRNNPAACSGGGL